MCPILRKFGKIPSTLLSKSERKLFYFLKHIFHISERNRYIFLCFNKRIKQLQGQSS